MKAKLTYFKTSGKYYTDGELEVSPTMPAFKIFDLVQEHRRQRTLPGLASGRWDGPIHVDLTEHPMGYPALVMPE